MKRTSLLATLALIALTLAGCGGSVDTADDPDLESAISTASSMLEATDAETVEDMAEDMAEDLEDLQDSQGGGGATLTVGDETWTFESVLCAFGPDEIGQEGAELVVSGIQDGLQLYVSIDSFGHSVTLNDIENFENPSVDLAAGGPLANLVDAPEEFIVVDGKNVSAEGVFVAGDDPTAGIDGTLEASCP